MLYFEHNTQSSASIVDHKLKDVDCRRLPKEIYKGKIEEKKNVNERNRTMKKFAIYFALETATFKRFPLRTNPNECF